MNNLLGLERMKLLKLIILKIVMMKTPPPNKYELPVVPEGYIVVRKLLETFLIVMIETNLRNC